MKEMTASEASRNFSAVLDAAEKGETVVVTRAGRRVATITGADRSNGAAARELIDRWRGNDAFDDTFAARVAEARSAASSEMDTDPWND